MSDRHNTMNTETRASLPMGIVDQAAKIVDEHAFEEIDAWIVEPDGDMKMCEPSEIDIARRNLRQAEAALKASRILKMASRLSRTELVAALVDDEVSRWKGLGVPADDPELRKVVANKIGTTTR